MKAMRDHPVLRVAVDRLRESGIDPTLEPGRGSHVKVRWVAPDGTRQMLVVARYNGNPRQVFNTLSLLNRKLRGLSQ